RLSFTCGFARLETRLGRHASMGTHRAPAKCQSSPASWAASRLFNRTAVTSSHGVARCRFDHFLSENTTRQLSSSAPVSSSLLQLSVFVIRLLVSANRE